MRTLTAALIVLLTLAVSAPADLRLPDRLKPMAFAGEADAARTFLESERRRRETSSAEWLAAVSWVARGALFAEDWVNAGKYAEEAFEGSVALIEKGAKIEDSADLETALGAAIEVLGKVYEAKGDRGRAVTFLSEQRENYRGAPVETRIQKNLLLASLEGQPMPPVAAGRFLSGGPQKIDVEGKVALFFFWAHWCGDCRQQRPILTDLHGKYSGKGLTIVGPTRLYGYTARGQDAGPDQELAYLEGPYRSANSLPDWMAMPLDQGNFVNFGVSTTPTLILVDRQGLVRLYHPGRMTYDELERAILPLL